LYHLDQKETGKRIEEILELVGLKEKSDILVETFSKGMIQRLQIARGLLNNPEILFMDEPTVGLDPLGARMLRDIIRKLKEEGRTILLTTHYMYEADELCDRIAILNNGKLMAVDTPGNLKKLAEEEEIIEVRLEGLQDSKIEEIKMLPGVRQTDLVQEDKEYLLTVKYNTGADMIERLLEVLKGIKIYALTNREITLEDVYIKMLEGMS
jgi:ABC-2 type transport system ATP-binding protein